MKPSLILMSHGHLAEQILESAKLIVGDVEGIYTVSMAMEDGLSGTQSKLDHVISSMPSGSEFLIIADIIGGTPCNVAVEKLFQSENIRVISGLNLGMLLEYALSSDENIDELCASVYDAGLTSVQIIQRPKGGAEATEIDE